MLDIMEALLDKIDVFFKNSKFKIVYLLEQLGVS